jgi:NarL family two-component system response regulator YdfI
MRMDEGGVVTRVLIATASEVTRSWFAAFPSRPHGLSIVGIAVPDAELSERVHELAPDVVVVDVTDNELETITSSLESIGDAAVDVILLTDGERWHTPTSELVRFGVRAVLSRRPTIDELESTVQAVSAGLVVLDPGVFEGLVPADDGVAAATGMTGSAVRASPAFRFPAQPLTPREIDVLNALAEGHGNKQIAARLEISEHTVKTHLAAIFEKLDASNRTEAVMAGARLGFLLL